MKDVTYDGLLELGVSKENADKIKGLAEPTISLRSYPATEEELSLRASKLAGLPDMPEDMPWPYHDGNPLWLAAQINLEDVAPYDKDHLLPTTGRLLFFFDITFETMTDTSADRGRSKVVFVPQNTPVGRRDYPEDTPFDEYGELGVAGAKIVQTLTYIDPYWEGMHYYTGKEELDSFLVNEDGDEVTDEYQELLSDVNESAALHRVFGPYIPVQGGNQPGLCDAISQTPPDYDYSNNTSNPYRDLTPEQREEREQALNAEAEAKWLLLAQVSYDESSGLNMGLGDCGSLYFWIKKENLAKGNFDDTWLIFQAS